ncbi:MAG: sulfatase [Planctomycetota bacterium]
MSNHRVSRFLTGYLLLTLSVIVMACSREDRSAYDLIRLAAPERIESAASERWDIMRVFFPIAGEKDSFTRIDNTCTWHPFAVQTVFGHKGAAQESTEPDSPRTEEGKYIITAGSGLASIVPVQPNAQYFLDCKGTFGSPLHLRAGAILLPKRMPFPAQGKSEALAGCLSRFRTDYAEFEAEKGSDTARIIISTKADTQAIALIVYSPRQFRGSLEQVRMVRLGSGVEAASPAKTNLNPEALASIVSVQPIGKVLKPSLLIPLNTEIRFKEVTIPDAPVFFCSLGLPFGMSRSVQVSLAAEDGQGTRHEIFRWQPQQELRGWVDIRKEIFQLSGKKVKLILSCSSTIEPKDGSAPASLVFCGAPVISSGRPSSGAPPYNIVLVSLDTLRSDHLGCYGYERPVSPNLDRMAAEGLLFRHAYAQASFTLPSHASLLTSLFPSIHGAEDFKGGRMSPSIDFMAEVLARNGMNTAAFTGGGLISHEFGFHEGFDVYCELDPLGDRFEDRKLPERYRLADGSSGSQNLGLSWIEDHRDQPFFFFLHTYMVHDFSPPSELSDRFNQGETKDLSLGMQTLPYLRKHFLKEPVPDQELSYCINIYDATILAADEMIGALMTRLEQLGIKDRTVVIVTSDHGEEFQDHGGLLHGCTLYEEMIRVPLVVYVPWLKSPRVIDEAVSHVDVMPTVLELLGFHHDGLLQGQSFLPVLKGKTLPARPVYAEVSLPTYTKVRCMIMDQWKYIEETRVVSTPEHAPTTRELYCLRQDPKEESNSLQAAPERAKSMKKTLEKMETNLKIIDQALGLRKKDSNELSPELTDFLKQLGYL